MDQPLHNYMRPGLVVYTAFPAAARDEQVLEQRIEALAADPFFNIVELGPVPGDEGTRERLVRLLRASKLDVIYEVQPGLRAASLDLNSLDEAHRVRAVTAAMAAIDEAAALGAERINLASGCDPGQVDRDAATDALFESLCALAAHAATQYRPWLALEAYPRRSSQRRLIGPTAACVELVRVVREVFPDFGITLDTGYSALSGEDITETVAAAIPYLGQIHLGNAVPGSELSAPRFGATGGAYDVAQVTDLLLTLFRYGFLGSGRRPPLVLRVQAAPDERPEWVIAGAKRTLVEAWMRL